jgi:hypothetical protein
MENSNLKEFWPLESYDTTSSISQKRLVLLKAYNPGVWDKRERRILVQRIEKPFFKSSPYWARWSKKAKIFFPKNKCVLNQNKLFLKSTLFLCWKALETKFLITTMCKSHIRAKSLQRNRLCCDTVSTALVRPWISMNSHNFYASRPIFWFIMFYQSCQ